MPGLVENLLAENREILQDVLAFLDHVTDETYTSPSDPCYGSSIGQQTRHLIEHAEAIPLPPSATVDFHQRGRDSGTETSRAVAHARLTRLVTALQEAEISAYGDAPVQVRHVLDSAQGPVDHWLESSLARELAFLQSHSIHHMALIGVMASLQGLHVPVGFGVAPSTRRYWQSDRTDVGAPGGQGGHLAVADGA